MKRRFDPSAPPACLLERADEAGKAALLAIAEAGRHRRPTVDLIVDAGIEQRAEDFRRRREARKRED